MLAGGLASMVGGCRLVQGGGELKFRLNLVLDTPSGRVEGSSVLVNRRRKGNAILGQMDPGTSYVLGQAPYLKFGGRYLFAVLNDPLYDRELKEAVNSFMAYGHLAPPISRPYSAWEWPDAFDELKRVKPVAALRREEYPMLVSFEDIDDVSTVEEVSPDSLAGSFGPDITLNSIQLSIVEPDIELSRGFEDQFPQIAFARTRLGSVPPNSGRAEFLAAKLRSDCFVRRPA